MPRTDPNIFNLKRSGQGDRLLLRIADSLCFECTEVINDKDFEIVFTDYDAHDAIVHAGECADKRRALDEE